MHWPGYLNKKKRYFLIEDYMHEDEYKLKVVLESKPAHFILL